MFHRLIATMLIATISLSGAPAAPAQQASSIITVPAGTVVPLTLVTPIKNKSTKPGDTIRAAIAFPVTVGDQVVIPQGTYVEGVLGPPAPKVKHRPEPGVQIHFTRLVFANGYSVPLDATQASLVEEPPSPAPPTAKTLLADFHSLEQVSPLDAMTPQPLRSPRSGSGARIALLAQTTPTLPPLPPLPQEGPNVGVIVGLSVGAPVLFVILALLLHHKAGSYDTIVHDAGWQFQMKLAAPVSVNASQVALASQANPAP